jgi:hypothetical protein
MDARAINGETALDFRLPTLRSALHLGVPQCGGILALRKCKDHHQSGVDCSQGARYVEAPTPPDRRAIQETDDEECDGHFAGPQTEYSERLRYPVHLDDVLGVRGVLRKICQMSRSASEGEDADKNRQWDKDNLIDEG